MGCMAHKDPPPQLHEARDRGLPSTAREHQAYKDPPVSSFEFTGPPIKSIEFTGWYNDQTERRNPSPMCPPKSPAVSIGPSDSFGGAPPARAASGGRSSPSSLCQSREATDYLDTRSSVGSADCQSDYSSRDSTVSVTRMAVRPERLWVSCGLCPALEGEYVRIAGTQMNGQIAWQKAGGDGWIFHCPSGRWMIAERLDASNGGGSQLRTLNPHYFRFPHQCSRWLFMDETGRWCTDANRVTLVTDSKLKAEHRRYQETEWGVHLEEVAAKRRQQAPAILWVLAPPVPTWQGEYRMERGGRHENGFPVWMQVNGDGCLFNKSSSHGDRWVVCGSEPRRSSKTTDVIRTPIMGASKWPEEVSTWHYRGANGSWSPDTLKSIRVTADRTSAEAVLAKYKCHSRCGLDQGYSKVVTEREAIPEAVNFSGGPAYKS